MKIKKIKRKPKVWLYPTAIEREYVKALQAITDNINREVELFLEKQRGTYQASIRQDGLSDWLENALVELLSAMLFWVSDSEIQRLVSGLLGEANRFNKKQFHQTLKKAYGTDIFTSEQWLLEQLKLFELQNINLIKSIPTQLHEKLRYKFVDAVQKGKRWEDLAKEIEELTGATKKRARLIARDQIGKLNGQLTQLRQKQIGVKSYIWRTSLDERVRKLHVSREGEQFDWDNSPNDGHPGEAIQCFPGDLNLNGFPFVRKFYRRWYTGKLTELILDNGVVLSATLNHPIMTSRGVQAIKDINLGDDLVLEMKQGFDTIKINGNSLIPTFEDIFSTLINFGVAFDVSSPRCGQFHGDISNGKVQIIDIYSLLINMWDRLINEKLPKLGFTYADMIFVKMLFSINSSSYSCDFAMDSSNVGEVSRFNLICSLLIRHFSPLELFCLGLISQTNFSLDQMFSDSSTANIEMFGNHIFACSALIHGRDFINWQRDRIMCGITSTFGHVYANSFEFLAKSILVDSDLLGNLRKSESLGVEVRRVINKRLVNFSGHVYNLETISGYYNTNSVLVSNCRCYAEAVLPEFDELLKNGVVVTQRT